MNALIYIEGLGATFTNSQGYFEFKGVKSGQTYVVKINAAGLNGQITTTLSSGSPREIALQQQLFNQYACEEINQSYTLAEAIKHGYSLNELTLKNLNRLRKLRPSRQIAKRMRKVLKQRLADYVNEASSMPTVALDCNQSAPTQCQKLSLSNQLRNLELKIKRLHRLSAKVNYRLRQSGARSQRALNADRGVARWLAGYITKLHQELKAESYSCN